MAYKCVNKSFLAFSLYVMTWGFVEKCVNKWSVLENGIEFNRNMYFGITMDVMFAPM